MAVNADRAEADLAPLDPAEIVAAVTSGGAGGGDGPASAGNEAEALRLEDRERRQSLWRFLLMGAFVLLALETVLSNRLPGRTATAGGRAGP